LARPSVVASRVTRREADSAGVPSCPPGHGQCGSQAKVGPVIWAGSPICSHQHGSRRGRLTKEKAVSDLLSFIGGGLVAVVATISYQEVLLWRARRTEDKAFPLKALLVRDECYANLET